MTALFEVIALIGAIATVFGALAITYFWISAFTNWLWMLTIRRWLVIAITLAVLLAVVVPVQILTGLDMLTSLGFLIGLVATPLIAVPLTDAIAHRLAPPDRRVGQTWRGFVFADRRRTQSEDYAAPSIDR